MIRLAQPIMIGAEYAQPLDVGTRACAGPSRRIMIRLAQPIMIGWVAALARHFVPKGLHHLSSPTHPGAELSHTSQPILRLSVNKLKVIKRQMYGRARFDLLRKRALLAQ